VINADLQRAVERVGLFYPPDPASLESSSIGGNVAECAGGPRAFKYGTTKRYVLALEAVLPTGQIVRTGSKAVKNVVGYDLAQLLVGSEGTLAIITKITLRLIPKPPARATLSATFGHLRHAVDAVTGLIGRGGGAAAGPRVDSAWGRGVGGAVGPTRVAGWPRAMTSVRSSGVSGGSSRWRFAQPDCSRSTTTWSCRVDVYLSCSTRSPSSHEGIDFASRPSAMPGTATFTSTSWSTAVTRTN
jgi:hypothetical protein